MISASEIIGEWSRSRIGKLSTSPRQFLATDLHIFWKCKGAWQVSLVWGIVPAVVRRTAAECFDVVPDLLLLFIEVFTFHGALLVSGYGLLLFCQASFHQVAETFHAESKDGLGAQRAHLHTCHNL